MDNLEQPFFLADYIYIYRHKAMSKKLIARIKCPLRFSIAIILKIKIKKQPYVYTLLQYVTKKYGREFKEFYFHI